MIQMLGAGIASVFQILVHKYKVEQQMQSLLSSGAFNQELIVFSDVDLKTADWEHSKEFTLNGQKYDVVFEHDQNGSAFYHCLSDDKEEVLYNQLAQKQAQQNKEVFELKHSVLSLVGLSVFALASSEFTLTHCQKWQSFYCYAFSPSMLKPPTA
jgi:hypothetical protein